MVVVRVNLEVVGAEIDLVEKILDDQIFREKAGEGKVRDPETGGLLLCIRQYVTNVKKAVRFLFVQCQESPFIVANVLATRRNKAAIDLPEESSLIECPLRIIL